MGLFIELMIHRKLTLCVTQFTGGPSDLQALGLSLFSLLVNPVLVTGRFDVLSKLLVKKKDKLQGTIHVLQGLVAKYFFAYFCSLKMLQIFSYWASCMQPYPKLH